MRTSIVAPLLASPSSLWLPGSSSCPEESTGASSELISYEFQQNEQIAKTPGSKECQPPLFLRPRSEQPLLLGLRLRSASNEDEAGPIYCHVPFFLSYYLIRKDWTAI